MISPVCCMCLALALISALGIKAVIVCAKRGMCMYLCVSDEKWSVTHRAYVSTLNRAEVIYLRRAALCIQSASSTLG